MSKHLLNFLKLDKKLSIFSSSYVSPKIFNESALLRKASVVFERHRERERKQEKEEAPEEKDESPSRVYCSRPRYS